MRIARVSAAGLLSAAVWSVAAAQPAIPIRQVAPPQGTATVGVLATARALSDGRVLVTSPTGPVVWVFDSSLTAGTSFFDSTQLAASSGPTRRWISRGRP